MKKILTLIASLCFSGLALAGGPDDMSMPVQQPAPYAAENGPYFGIHGGAAFTPDQDFDIGFVHVDTGFDVGGQLGYRFTQNVRIEGAFTYIRNSFTACVTNGHSVCGDAALNSYLGMANAYYDLHLTPMIDPFLGFGIGFDHISTSASNVSVDGGTKFAYQAIAGLGFNIIPNSLLSVRYRFVGTADTNDFHYNILEASFDYFI